MGLQSHFEYNILYTYKNNHIYTIVIDLLITVPHKNAQL